MLQHGLDRAAATLAAAPSPAAIHRTRVAARRLRVLLNVHARTLESKARKRYRRELKKLADDLEPAREADVARRLLLALARNSSGDVGASRGLCERAVRRCESTAAALRETLAGAAWRRRLAQLQQLSVLTSLAKENDDSAATVTHRLVTRYRRRLRSALSDAGSNPAKLHRIRLKIKSMRYLLEACLPRSAIEKNEELKRLRRIQNCLGDIHDAENVRKTLRAERTDRKTAHEFRERLKNRKGRRLRDFKKDREALTRLWGGSD
ncbi:MAG: CHAD domain-containing protein [Steroidobacteraceae bacterium]